MDLWLKEYAIYIAATATPIAAFLAVWVSLKSRKAAFRERIFNRQVEIIEELLQIGHNIVMRKRRLTGAKTKAHQELLEYVVEVGQSAYVRCALYLDLETSQIFFNVMQVGLNAATNAEPSGSFPTVEDALGELINVGRKFLRIEPLTAENLKIIGSVSL